MSNFLAVATVTAALSQVIRTAVTDDVSGANVTVARPHSSSNGTTAEDPTVNLYLFQVVPNKSLSNNEYPTRNSIGDVTRRSQIALDLNYLLTFYGDESVLIPQRLLGSVLRTLNSRPILSKEVIRNTVTNSSFSYLSDSDLANAVESVKFSHMPFSLEELSKLWSVFLQTPYTLSVAFHGSVVLLDGLETAEPALPVRVSNIYVNPFRMPKIDRVESESGIEGAIDATSTVLIYGTQLRGDITNVRIASVDVLPSSISDTKVSVPLSSVPVENLRAGVQSIQIIHPLSIGTPAVAHPGVESSAAAMTILPIISSSAIANVSDPDPEPRSATITLQLNPRVGKNQELRLLMNEVIDNEPQSYSFVAKSRTTDGNSVEFVIKGVKVARYLLRVQVDGAMSQLTSNSDGEFINPTLVIT